MHEQVLSNISPRLMGVSVQQKRMKGAYKKTYIDIAVDGLHADLERVKEIPTRDIFTLAYFVLWKWAIRQDYYDSHIRGILFTREMLVKVDAREFDLAYTARILVHQVQHTAVKKPKAYLTALKYCYRLDPDLECYEELDRDRRLAIKL